MANEIKAVNLVPTPEKFALTGISGLDSILEGGIPRSNVTLVEGAIGTGQRCEHRSRLSILILISIARPLLAFFGKPLSVKGPIRPSARAG